MPKPPTETTIDIIKLRKRPRTPSSSSVTTASTCVTKEERLTLSLGGNRTLKNECSRALARALGLYRRPPNPHPHRLYRRSQHRPWNHQKQSSPSSPVAPDAALGTARGYGQSTPRELQLSYPATLSSAMLRATRTGPRARAPATPAIPLARTGSGCGCAAPPSSLRTGRVGE